MDGLPELYTSEQAERIERHIQTFYGHYDYVAHEIISPDIHVDICIIQPTEARNYITLVTMGMGAHQMDTPLELKEEHIDRAELVLCLPPWWDLKSEDEQWYWPVRWLKIMARLPGNYETWLGYGHTVPAGEPFAANTALSGMLVLNPGIFPHEGHKCILPSGETVNFYQLIPLYDEEMEFKLLYSASALLDKMDFEEPEEIFILDLQRPNFCKKP